MMLISAATSHVFTSRAPVYADAFCAIVTSFIIATILVMFIRKVTAPQGPVAGAH